MPALFTRTVIAPNCARTVSAIAPIEAGSTTSTWHGKGPIRPQLGRCPAGALDVDVGDRDLGPRLAKHGGDGVAYPRCAADDDRVFPFQAEQFPNIHIDLRRASG